MRRIGVRELRQQASVWLRQVEAGESFEITDRGRPVALLVPLARGDELARLEASGRLTRPQGDILSLGDPLPPEAGVPLPSDVLREARAEER